jgi:transposase
MANQPMDMSKIRKVLHLYHQGRSKLFISDYLSVSRNTVTKYINLFQLLKIDFEQLNRKSDLELEILFFGNNPIRLTPELKKLYTFFPYAEKQLRKPGTTKLQLWQEYKLRHPQGVQSTQFCEHFLRWSKKVNPVMRITHKAGDKMYVDYAGKTLEIIDRQTGEVKKVQFFVAILGSSQYTFAEATLSQGKEDFIGSLQSALHYFGGVPKAIVPDNLKSAVTKADRYEPTINETLLDFASHYGTAVLPARAYRPRDKSLVEGAVKILYQRIYTQLKNNTYHTLAQLNKDIELALTSHNNKLLTGRSYSRLKLFNEVEKQELDPLPVEWFYIKSQHIATVMQNGHVLLSKDKHYYSVPYQFIRKKVKILYSKHAIEIFYKHTRIAIHERNYKKYDYTTNTDHLASTHKFMTEWTPQRFIQWADTIDESVKEYICKVLEMKQHPEQAYKSCLGILSMIKKQHIGKQRLIMACRHGLDFGVYNYQMIKNILEKELDKLHQLPGKETCLPDHPNIRGNKYYN